MNYRVSLELEADDSDHAFELTAGVLKEAGVTSSNVRVELLDDPEPDEC